MRTELCELATRFGTDKCNWHHYTEHYHAMLGDRRNEILKVLEIGIGDPASMSNPTGGLYEPGASLRMWRDYFPNAQIYAIDNNSRLLINEGRIQSFWCDQGSLDSLHSVIPLLGYNFDLIVDDGSHVPEHQAATANVLIPILASNGIYVIEDVWPYPSTVGWHNGPFGLKLESINYPVDLITCTPGNCDDHLVVFRNYP